LRHDIKRFDKNKCGYTDVALVGDDEVPSDKDRPGGKHPSEPSETVFLPHSRTLRTDISLFSNLPPESLGYIYPVLLLGWKTAVRNVRNSGVRSSFESQSLALWRYSRIAQHILGALRHDGPQTMTQIANDLLRKNHPATRSAEPLRRSRTVSSSRSCPAKKSAHLGQTRGQHAKVCHQI
jgi:hypothetical protein